jgi:tetratricopeptide (TPR) repeat protein
MWLGREESALLMLKRANSLDPRDPETHGLLARLHVGRGNLAAAEGEYRTLLALDSANSDAYYQLALISLRRNEPKKAAGLYRALIRNSRDFDPRAYLSLGELQTDLGEFAEAEAVYRRLLDFDSTEALGHFGLAKVREAMKDTAGAEASYRAALEIEPGLGKAREQLGELYLGMGNTEAALDLYRRGVSADSTDAASWIAIGNVHRERGDTAEAVSAFEEAARRFPEDWQAPLNLGRMLLDGGKNAEAFARFKTVVARSPGNFWGLVLGGIALVHEDSLSAAVPWLEGALEQQAGDPLANYYLGTTFTQLDRSVEAVPLLLRALGARPGWEGAQSALAGAYESLGDHARADSLFEAVLARNPENSLVLNNYAYSLSERGVRLEEALAMSKRAVEKDPENGAYLDTMGWILYKMGDYGKAAPLIERANALRPGSADVVEHLGDVYDRLGRREEAERCWRRALELDPGNPGLLKKLGPAEGLR